MVLKKLVQKCIGSSDERTVRAKKNIFLSFGVKGCSILVSLALVPVTLGYLNVYEYGVWLTLSSILMWINYFDVGLGNGLRNKLAEALALGDLKKGQIYISTTVALLSIIMLCVYGLYLIVHPWISWYSILNVPVGKTAADLNSLVLLVFAFFCLSFIFKFIGNVYLAKQQSVVNDLLVLGGNVIALAVIYVLTKLTEGDLRKVALTFSIAPLVVYLVAYPVTFFYKYKDLRPKWSLIDFRYAKSLLFLGGQFFVIQIACLVIFSTSNFFISQLCTPADVTVYNIVFKYFSCVTMVFIILITPFWSAATEAYTKGDFQWIRKSVRNMLKCWFGLVFLSILMLLLSGWVYKIWVDMSIPVSLSALMLLYVSIVNWNNLFAYFLNGIGKIQIQLYCAIASGIIFIPLALFLGKLYGVNGICLTMCVSLLVSSIALPIQYKSIIRKNK